MSNKTIGPSALLSINDAAALRVKGLTLDIKPGQDLNGYDHPWMGGCGKNLWPPLTTTTYAGITYTQNNDGSVKVNGTATSYSLIQNIVTLPAGTYTLSIGTTSDLGPRISVRNNSTDSAYATIYKNSADFTLSSDTEVRMRILINANTTVNNALIWPMLRLASNTDSNFELYENICPISGWTEANIVKCGKNIHKNTRASVVSAKGITFTPIYDNDNNIIGYNCSGQVTGDNVFYNIDDNYKLMNLRPGNYTISGSTADIGFVGFTHLPGRTSDSSLFTSKNGQTTTFTVPENALYCWIRLQVYATNAINVNIYPMICAAETTDTTFEPYKDKIYSISLPSTAGTVYGGTLDVVNKELTVTHKTIVLDGSSDETINYIGSASAPCYRGTCVIPDDSILTDDQYSTGFIICDKLPEETNNNTYNGKIGIHMRTNNTHQIVIGLGAPGYSTAEDWRAWLVQNPLTVVYKLATPLIYSLTDNQFITLFQGSNNLWSECGDLTLTYKPLQLDKIVDSEQLDEAMVITADAIRAKNFATDEIPWNLATGFKDAIDTITGTGGDGVRIIDEPDGNGGIIRRIITDAPVPIINPAIENINFYDYDGAVLYSYTPSDFLALTEMPPNPNHTVENLTAQGWNWSLSNAKEHVTKYGSLDIGQTYITADGKTHIHIFIPNDTPTNRRLFTLRWGQTVSEGVTVDWGDGTSTETFSGTSAASHDHTYTNTGEYDITLTVTSGNLTFGESQSSGGYAIYGTVSNATIYKRDYITKIEIGDNVSRIDDFSFYYCHSLQSITIPKGISYFGWYVFERCVNLTTIIFPNNFTTITEATCLNCYSLKNILLPDSITTINSKSFSYCYALTLIKSFVLKTTKNTIFSNDLNLKSVYVSDTLTELGSSVFNSCPSLTTITLPATLTKIGTQTFYGCYCLSAIHILATTPPTLDNSNAFTGIPSDCVIYVPYSSDHSILNAYKAATNWSSYTSYLQEEPQ